MAYDIVANRQPLAQETFQPLPLGAVRPTGWLQRQCQIQADGLTGNLEEHWPDIGPDNMWLGGKTEGWERGPYYLDGLVPLAHILDDPRLKLMAVRWLDSILNMQSEDGWLGPVQAPDRLPYDHWPVAIVMKVLPQHYEATGDPRVVPVMTGFCAWLRDNLSERPLFEWGKFRWADMAISIIWLYNRTGDGWLLDLMDMVKRQGFDWRSHFTNFEVKSKVMRKDATLATHVVNNAMAIKSGAIAWMRTNDADDLKSSLRAIEMLDLYHGQATGVLAGDEHLAGREPFQGTELCAVVEYMYSLETLLAASGNSALADRLESIAYNALPGTFTPDMWAHQYDQQANQVLCSIAKRQWETNGDDANIFGLEPNYGCCTANMHQGWPKLVSHLWMATPNGGLAATAYGPCTVAFTTASGAEATIEEETDYPFREEIKFTITMDSPARFPLSLRTPAWVEGATIRCGNGDIPLEPGRYHVIERTWQSGDTAVLTLPMQTKVERREHGAVAVRRGPIVYSLRIGEEFRLIKGEPPCADWEIYPTTPWNYGLIVNEHDMNNSFVVHNAPIADRPFDPANAPVYLTALARRIPEWKMQSNSCAATPQSPVESNEPMEEVTMIPYGSAHLRITEFPVIAE